MATWDTWDINIITTSLFINFKPKLQIQYFIMNKVLLIVIVIFVIAASLCICAAVWNYTHRPPVVVSLDPPEDLAARNEERKGFKDQPYNPYNGQNPPAYNYSPNEQPPPPMNPPRDPQRQNPAAFGEIEGTPGQMFEDFHPQPGQYGHQSYNQNSQFTPAYSSTVASAPPLN
jgi:hypothetical protein